MKILITGATGLIGTKLVAHLSEKNIDVHYLSTHKEPKSKPGVTGFYWNPEQGIIDENCMLGVDVIIHLAGASISKRWTESYKQEIIESRTLTANLLFKILKNNPHQVKQLISASAIGFYPDSLNKVYSEDFPTPDNSFLGHVVQKWEESVDKFRFLGMKVCKIRTGLVLAKDGSVLQEMKKPIQFGVGSPFGTGKQWQSWIHIDDLVEMYFYAVQNQLEGIYNGVAPTPVTNLELTSKIAKVLSKPFFMPNIPKFLMKLVLGEMHILLFASQNVSALKIINAGFHFRFEKLDEALQDLLA